MAENSVVKQPTFRIKGVTVSLEISDKTYGNGNSAYTSINAYVDAAGLAQIDDVISAGLDMFLAAWETVLAGKVATKLLGMSAQELRDNVAAIQKRAARVRTLLREGHADFKKEIAAEATPSPEK